jgi:hypothetical protein
VNNTKRDTEKKRGQGPFFFFVLPFNNNKKERKEAGSFIDGKL